MDPSQEEVEQHLETAVVAAQHHVAGEAMDPSLTTPFPSSSQSRWFSDRTKASPENASTSVPFNSAKTPEEAAKEARKQLLDKFKVENPFETLFSPISRYIAGWESGKTGETFEKLISSVKDGRWKEYASLFPITAERIVDKVKDWISSFK